MKKVYSAPQIVTSVIEKEDILTTSPGTYVSSVTERGSAGRFFNYSDFGGTQ